MKHFYNNLKGLIIAMVCCIPFMTNAQLIVNNAVTGTDLANSILGSGVTVSNVSLNAANGSYGIFSNGATTNIGIAEGILLTSGQTSDAIGPNSASNAGNDNHVAGDSDLNALVGGGTQDATVLEFDFVAESNTISVQYVFGSEEYPEWVCSQYNDVFAFFVTGNNPSGPAYSNTNVALIPSSILPVSINNVNASANNCDGNFTGNNIYFVNNAGGSTIQYDGFTVPIRWIYCCFDFSNFSSSW